MVWNVDLSFPLSELEYFLLIMTRVSMFVFAAPFFGQQNVPRMLRAAFAVLLSFVLYEAITPHQYVEYRTTLEYTGLVLKEAVVGMLIGLMANWTMQIAAFAGQIVDTDIGFSMASQVDPATQMNTTVSGYFYQYGFMLIFLATGMYRELLRDLAGSFTLIPLGQAEFALERMNTAFLEFITEYVALGFRISLPIFCVTLMVNCLLGIMAKVSPQMNMFAVGMQIKALIGLCILFLTVRLLPGAADIIFTEMRTAIVRILQAMGGAA
ncbi:MAG: flagellar biosynthetic protein FliR [Lachnospiraceae bacterium]|nr:flagellar biosynthetic protein FliR [Lachnospiraceae bacterium]